MGDRLSHAKLGGDDAFRELLVAHSRICELNAFDMTGTFVSHTITITITAPSSFSINPRHCTFLTYHTFPARAANRPSIQAPIFPRYVNPKSCHMSTLLHLPSSASPCLQCQQAARAASSCPVTHYEHSYHPLRRCKMASPTRNNHRRQRKSLFLELADADAILDQSPPSKSTKALLSSKMGDATVNGDMPSSSFLSVSSTLSPEAVPSLRSLPF